MENRKIVDYIVVYQRGRITEHHERSLNFVSYLERRIHSDTKELTHLKSKLKVYKEIKTAYLRALEKDPNKEISKVDRIKIGNKELEILYSNPNSIKFGKLKGYERTNEYKNQLRDLDFKMNPLSKVIDTLNESIRNDNSTLNKIHKPKIEREVLELIELGYVPLNGINSDKYGFSQAMVKYEK